MTREGQSERAFLLGDVGEFIDHLSPVDELIAIPIPVQPLNRRLTRLDMSSATFNSRVPCESCRSTFRRLPVGRYAAAQGAVARGDQDIDWIEIPVEGPFPVLSFRDAV